MNDTKLIDLFQTARRSQDLIVIEGVQALKHAVRFKADIKHILTCDITLLTKLLDDLAPDIVKTVLQQVTQVNESTFNKLSPQPPRTKTIALAVQKQYSLNGVAQDKPIIALENPRDLENIGAVIRVSAAADAAAVCITGPSNVWHPAVIRGGAGLHFAVPVLNVNLHQLFNLDRQVIALDPTGTDIKAADIPKNTVLLFGTERYGINKETLQKTDQIVRLNMKPGVSSLNLATSVSATLYSLQ